MRKLAWELLRLAICTKLLVGEEDENGSSCRFFLAFRSGVLEGTFASIMAISNGKLRMGVLQIRNNAL